VSETPPVRNDAATREGLGTPAMQQLVGEAKPFSDLLQEMTPQVPQPPLSPAARAYAEAEALPVAEPEATTVPEPEVDPTPEPKRVAALREGMVAAGLGADLAAVVVDAVVTNVAPFATPGRLRTLVRNELALRLPVAPAPGPGRRHLAVVGPAGTGKTAAVARVAAAHAAAGQDVACLTLEPADAGAALRAMLEGSGVTVEAISYEDLAVALLGASAQLVLIDTPAAAPSSGVTVESLGATLGAAGVDEIHLAVRAGTASPAAVEMFENLKGLDPNRILVSAAADTSYIGAAVDVAIRTSLPVHYVAETVVELAPADPRDLASRVVP
jgi:flagellar biosynthesis GTPase FlhF